jgi:hypothetical protein
VPGAQQALIGVDEASAKRTHDGRITMKAIRRRTFVRGAAVGALAFTVGGTEVFLLPREARAQKIPLKALTADDAARLEAVVDALVPGAREAGIAHFVDQQCAVP